MYMSPKLASFYPPSIQLLEYKWRGFVKKNSICAI